MKTAKLLLLAFITIITCSCSDRKQQQLVDSLTMGINEGNSAELTKVFPGVDAFKLDFKGCKISIAEDSIVKNEADDQLTISASITKKDGTNVPVKFTATKGEDAYTISDASGILPFAENALWATVAKKTGALNSNASEKDVLKFVNDESNIDNIKALLEKLKSNILKVKVKYSHSNWHYGDCDMNTWGEIYYKVTITNSSDYTFPAVTANISDVVSCGRISQNSYNHTPVRFKSLKPGVNEKTYSFGFAVDYLMIKEPYLSSLSGITDEDYQKAMQSYKFTGNEYADYMKKH